MKEKMKERGKDKVFVERTDKNSQVRMDMLYRLNQVE
jgi:hypothetical protein